MRPGYRPGPCGCCAANRMRRARQLLQDIKQAVYDGDLVALCGVVGAGKTVMRTKRTKGEYRTVLT